MECDLHIKAVPAEGGTAVHVEGSVSLGKREHRYELLCSLADVLDIDLSSMSETLLLSAWAATREQAIRDRTTIKTPKN